MRRNQPWNPWLTTISGSHQSNFTSKLPGYLREKLRSWVGARPWGRARRSRVAGCGRRSYVFTGRVWGLDLEVSDRACIGGARCEDPGHLG